MTSTGKGVQKRDLSCVAGGREIVKTPEDSLAAPQMDRRRVTIEFSNVFPK